MNIEDLKHLSWEFSVLQKAVTFKNLSSASLHVRLSQPQLSRIIAKLETSLGLSLLDRSAKRQSSWTPQARKLAEIYLQHQRRFEEDLQSLHQDTQTKTLRVAILEGFVHIAVRYAQEIMRQAKLEFLEIDVHDLNKLEELFLNENYDVIMTARMPSRKKYKYVRSLGWQMLVQFESGPEQVLSSFEYYSEGLAKKDNQIVVSNSLEFRRQWLEKRGGTGSLPSQILPEKPQAKKIYEVMIVAHEKISQSLWSTIEKVGPQVL